MVEQESKEQDPSALHQKYSKAIFRITTGLFVALAGIGALLLGTIGQGEPQVLRWYVLTLVVAGVGTGFGALLWLKTVELLFYGQVLALVGLFGCSAWLVFVVLSVVFSEPPLPPPPPPPPPDDAQFTVTASESKAGSWPDDLGNYFTYEPEKAIDGQDDTAWRVPGDGKQQWIQLDYTSPVEVSMVGIIVGHDKIDPGSGTDRFYQLYTVRQASIEFSDGTAEGAEFRRDRSMQWVRFDAPKATKSVRINIIDTYPPDDHPDGEVYPYLVYETAISEIKVR